MEKGCAVAWKYPMAPSPSRGMPFHVGVNPKGTRFGYPSQDNAVLRELSVFSNLSKDLKNWFIAFDGHSKSVSTVQFSTVNDKIASGDILGNVNIWNSDHPTLMSSWDILVLQGPIHDACFSDDGERVAAVGENTHSGKFGGILNIKLKKTDCEMSAHGGRALGVTMKPKRPMKVFSVSEDNTMNSFQGPPFSLIKNEKIHGNFINGIRACPVNNLMVTVSSDKSFHILNSDSGEIIKTIKDAHTGSIYSVCWFEDGARFATCSADKTVKVWSQEGELLSTLSIAENPAIEDMQMGVAKIQGYLLSVSLSGDINLWQD